MHPLMSENEKIDAMIAKLVEGVSDMLLPSVLKGELAHVIGLLAQRNRELAAANERAGRADREIERSFQMLEIHGVPRERARHVSNGIDVLSTRMQRAIFDAERLAEENARDAERWRKFNLVAMKHFSREKGCVTYYLPRYGYTGFMSLEQHLDEEIAKDAARNEEQKP